MLFMRLDVLTEARCHNAMIPGLSKNIQVHGHHTLSYGCKPPNQTQGPSKIVSQPGDGPD